MLVISRYVDLVEICPTDQQRKLEMYYAMQRSITQRPQLLLSESQVRLMQSPLAKPHRMSLAREATAPRPDDSAFAAALLRRLREQKGKRQQPFDRWG